MIPNVMHKYRTPQIIASARNATCMILRVIEAELCSRNHSNKIIPPKNMMYKVTKKSHAVASREPEKRFRCRKIPFSTSFKPKSKPRAGILPNNFTKSLTENKINGVKNVSHGVIK